MNPFGIRWLELPTVLRFLKRDLKFRDLGLIVVDDLELKGPFVKTPTTFKQCPRDSPPENHIEICHSVATVRE